MTPATLSRTADDTPEIEVLGFKAAQVLKEPAWIEAMVRDPHPRWPIKRVEFFIDSSPYSLVACDMRGPRFAVLASMIEIPFAIEK
jgi:hypothetical protein